MNYPLVAIGPFIFYATAPSFNMLRTTLEPRWSEQERIARSPSGQFIGSQNPTIDLNGIIYPGIFGSRDIIDNMMAAANTGEIFTVVGMSIGSASGFNGGQFYIRSIQNEKSYFDPDGAQKIDFQVTLRGYGADNQATNFGGKLFQ